MDYNNPIPVAVGLIQVNEGSLRRVLGVIRAIEPVGGLALPGGYVDAMECAEQAVAREVMQETGLQTNPQEWSLMRSLITPSNRMLIFCKLNRVTSVQEVYAGFKINEEVEGLKMLHADSKLCFPLHEEALKLFFQGL